MSSTPSPNERRGRTRQRGLMQGRICYGPQAAICLPCVIRNLTEVGAMLEVPADQLLPGAFSLLHVAKGVAFDARLTWREGARAGVSFEGSHNLNEAVAADLRQLRRIWIALTAC